MELFMSMPLSIRKRRGWRRRNSAERLLRRPLGGAVWRNALPLLLAYDQLRSSVVTRALLTMRSGTLVMSDSPGNRLRKSLRPRRHSAPAACQKCALRTSLPARRPESRTRQKPLAHRDDLLAGKHAEETHQRDQRRRRRADVDQAIDDTNHYAGAQGEEYESKCGILPLALRRHGRQHLVQL